MPYPHHHRTAATRHQPPADAALDLDALIIDDECDDFLDRHVATIRESLAERLF